MNSLEQAPRFNESVPQIHSVTGVSQDYQNEFFMLDYILQADTISNYWQRLKPIRHYTERFPESQFDNVINDQNREAIRRLDEIVDRINELITSPQVPVEEVDSLRKQAYELIYGQK